MKTLSKITLVICYLLFTIASFFLYPKWKHNASEATISWDVSGYYAYLPAVFIYNDLKKLSYHDSLLNKYKFTPYATQYTDIKETGNRVLIYSSGLALQFAPFFFIAHYIAPVFHYAQDGFSLPYQIAISFGALIMSFIGLYYLRKILLEYFNDITTAFTIILIALGTNYFNYVVADAGMAHSWLFNLYCILIYQTIQFYKAPTYIRSVFIGLLVGLITLTRPTDIISALIPILWGINTLNWNELKIRMSFFKTHYPKIIVAVLFCMMVGSIQLFYWKYITGHWFYYSYSNLGFYWLDPFFMDYIFSYRSGWLVYTPVMFLAIFGIPFLVKSKFQIIPVLLFLLLNVWYVTAWEVWWYGARAMIQSYAIFSFPLAFFIQFLLKYRFTKFILFFLVAGGLLYNLWFTMGVHNGVLDYSNMTKNYYWKSVGRFSVEPEIRKYLDVDDYYNGAIKDSVILFELSAYTDTIDGTPYYQTNKNSENEILYLSKNIDRKSYNWVRVNVEFFVNGYTADLYFMHELVLACSKNNVQLKINKFRPERLSKYSYKETSHFEIKFPEEEFDKLELIIYKPPMCNGPLFIKSLNICGFNAP